MMVSKIGTVAYSTLESYSPDVSLSSPVYFVHMIPSLLVLDPELNPKFSKNRIRISKGYTESGRFLSLVFYASQVYLDKCKSFFLL